MAGSSREDLPNPWHPYLSQGPYLSPASEGTAEAVSAVACFPLGTSSTISAWRGTSVVSMVGRWLGSLQALLRLCKRGATGVRLWAGAQEVLVWGPVSPASTWDA